MNIPLALFSVPCFVVGCSDKDSCSKMNIDRSKMDTSF